jgi:hypothetical protein
MKYIIEAGTDGATLAAFDPESLPDGFDTNFSNDPPGTLELMQQEGKLWVGETHGDGFYVFHVYVNEPTPQSKLVTRTLVKEFSSFPCPSGELCICGAEYAAKNPSEGSASVPKDGSGRNEQMAAKVSLSPGNYRLRVFCLDFSKQKEHEERESTRRRFDLNKMLKIASELLLGAGSLAVIPLSIALVLGLVVKVFRWITDSTKFHEISWFFVVVMPLTGLVLASLAIFLGMRLHKLYLGTPEFNQEEQRRLAKADFELELEHLTQSVTA